MQNNFSISNTDVVTMLMVKKTKELEEERLLVIGKRLQILEAAILRINKDMEKLQVKVQPYIDAWRSIIQLYNPKKEFKFESRLEYETYNVTVHWGTDLDKKPYININFTHIPLYLDFENEDDYNCIEPNNGFYAPVKFKKIYEISEDYITITNRLRKIDDLLANKEKFKTEIIAKVTENALMQNSDLKLLADGVILDI